MKERPIIFSTEMVRAILAGRKSVTRRVVVPQPHTHEELRKMQHYSFNPDPVLKMEPAPKCPWEIRDVLYVRESFAVICGEYPCSICNDETVGPVTEEDFDVYHLVEYKADTDNPYPGNWPVEEARGNPDAPKWRSGRFMPKRYARLWLTVGGLGLEKLWDITPNGITEEGFGSIDQFRSYWDKLNGKRGYGWLENPFVWVLQFTIMVNGWPLPGRVK